MAIKKSEIYSQIWAACDKLRAVWNRLVIRITF